MACVGGRGSKDMARLLVSPVAPPAISLGESANGPGSDLAQPGTPEFSAVLFRADPVAGGHVDATHGVAMAGIPPHRLAAMVGTRHFRRAIPGEPVFTGGGSGSRAV